MAIPAVFQAPDGSPALRGAHAHEDGAGAGMSEASSRGSRHSLPAAPDESEGAGGSAGLSAFLSRAEMSASLALARRAIAGPDTGDADEPARVSSLAPGGRSPAAGRRAQSLSPRARSRRPAAAAPLASPSLVRSLRRAGRRGPQSADAAGPSTARGGPGPRGPLGDQAARLVEELTSVFREAARPRHRASNGESSSPDSGYLSPNSRPAPRSARAPAAPRFVQKLRSQEVAEGSRVRLECRVCGNPAPRVRWFCEGKELHDSPDIQIRGDGGDLHTLVIAEAFEDDTGRYTCLATNPSGSDTTSAEVFVEGASSTDSDSESLAFKLKGGAMPQAQKKTTSVSLTIGASSPKTGVTTAVIQPLSVPVQQVQSPTSHLCQPDGTAAAPFPPVFTKELQNTTAAEGRVVVLECRVRGAPAPQVRWFRQGSEIQDSPDFRILQKKPRSTAEPDVV
ncbi:PREDICTED: palladin-like [Propithecus coquereli]|uniref:palladin-like n=1 Tax=Propithecus coquereli TaxID=379532 RepID=UPI00063EFDA5|nr:PREDICTED: palladin-like [Propithecus coquereli]